MAVYKEEKTNTWRVLYRYTDWNGERKQSQKRGFKTKREAQAWEREQLNKLGGDLDMNFKSFVEHYSEDMQTRLKENTWETKKHIIDKKLVPYFGKLKMCNITAQQIITWQNELINYKDDKGKPYSPVYLKTIHNQLSAIFNHAVRYYNLKENPCQKAGSMGKKKNREMLFWTKDEYLKFADVMMDKPISYYAFEMLYWTGIREGELLALTPEDFDFEKQTVTINKSFQHLNGRDIITSPKTEKRNRALFLYGVQLAVNFLWPVFFFNAGWYLFAFAWLLFLWYLVYLCTKAFSEISRTAGYLMIPYLVWLTFAGYLNFFIFLLN